METWRRRVSRAARPGAGARLCRSGRGWGGGPRRGPRERWTAARSVPRRPGRRPGPGSVRCAHGAGSGPGGPAWRPGGCGRDRGGSHPPHRVVFLPARAQPGAVHHILGYLRPFRVGEQAVLGGGTHRGVPDRLGVPPLAERIVGQAEQADQAAGVPAAVGAQRRFQVLGRPVACDDVRVGVFFAAAGAVQVADQPGQVLAARADLPDHRSPNRQRGKRRRRGGAGPSRHRQRAAILRGPGHGERHRSPFRRSGPRGEATRNAMAFRVASPRGPERRNGDRWRSPWPGPRRMAARLPVAEGAGTTFSHVFSHVAG